jgi:hypothetical protein
MIVGAIMGLIMLALAIRARAMDWYAITITGALMVFGIVVGIKLIRRPSKLDD